MASISRRRFVQAGSAASLVALAGVPVVGRAQTPIVRAVRVTPAAASCFGFWRMSGTPMVWPLLRALRPIGVFTVKRRWNTSRKTPLAAAHLRRAGPRRPDFAPLGKGKPG